MYTILVIASMLGLSTATSIGVFGKEESLSLDSLGGGGGQPWASLSSSGGDSQPWASLDTSGGGSQPWASLDSGSQPELSLGGGSSSYSGPSSYDTSSSKGSTGDYHHGVSILGGGSQQSASFDLTNQGGGSGHSGAFGGSFVASAKYEGQVGAAQKVSDTDLLAGLLSSGSPQYTDVLQASEGGSSGGFKWGVEDGY